MASPGEQALAALPDNAAVNDKREALNRVYDIAVWQNVARTATYIPWASEEELLTGVLGKRRAQFEAILARDQKAAFAERVEFYQRRCLLKSDVMSWMDCPMRGQHAIYILQDQFPQMMFTIGSTLLYDLPEVLFYFDGAIPLQTCGHLLNDLVDRMKKGTVEIGQSMQDLWDMTGSSDSMANVLRHATAQDLERVGMMSWFHRNFLDKELQDKNVWVVELRIPTSAVPAVRPFFKKVVNPKSKLMKKDGFASRVSRRFRQSLELYEAEGNVCEVKHGLVTDKPTLRLGPAMSPRTLTRMVGGLSTEELCRLQEELGKDVLNAWAYKHAAAVLHGQPLVDHILKEARRVRSEKERGNSECKPLAEPIELMNVAVINNQPASVAQLFSLGIQGEKLRGDGVTRSLLMMAVQLGFVGVVKHLLDGGAPLDDTDREKWTALSLAAYGQIHGSHERAQRILDLLWEAGARLM